jgi:hypothetical protein
MVLQPLGRHVRGISDGYFGFLVWREPRVNRQQIRALRRESRDIPREEDNEWTAKELLYAAAFVISFLFVWYLVPNVLLTS